MEEITAYLNSPIGTLKLNASAIGLREVALYDGVIPPNDQHSDILTAAADQLTAYFNGDLMTFDLPFDFTNAPTFHCEVWQALRTIPYGQKRTYKDIANMLGQPGGSQAVGQANAKNPIAIIIPCHRIIGSNGKLTGYAWGIERKRWLLEHEYANSPKPAHLLF